MHKERIAALGRYWVASIRASGILELDGILGH